MVYRPKASHCALGSACLLGWTRRAINLFVLDVNIQPNRSGVPALPPWRPPGVHCLCPRGPILGRIGSRSFRDDAMKERGGLQPLQQRLPA
jgi:hypothetical protein